MREPTDILREEHRVIEKGLDALEKVCDSLEAGSPFQPRVLEQILDFVKGFADSAHHMKEEDLLFPALERAGLPVEGGPVSVMLAEHRQARQLVADIGRAVVALSEGQGGDNSTLIGPARAYVGHLRSHIGKEDECLFPIADDRLNAAAREELAADFDVAQEQFGRERYFAYLKLFKGE